MHDKMQFACNLDFFYFTLVETTIGGENCRLLAIISEPDIHRTSICLMLRALTNIRLACIALRSIRAP